MVNVTPKQCGKNVRMNFGKINEVLEMPNLIEVQKNSYRWFREEGLKEVFRDVSSITDYNGNLVLNFIDYRIDEKPKYTIAECKEQDATYAAALRVTATLWNKETGEVKESEIYMGDFPLMTESGTFVINGAERVIVSQLVRSPGVYYASEKDRTGKDLFKTTVIPNRGAWLEYEMDSNDVIYVRIDKNRKIALTTFIRAIGIGTDEEIYEMFGDDERLRQTILQKDSTKNTEDALLDVYKKLRPGEPPTVESSLTHLNNLFFDAKRYDLCRFGRYKYNKKLGIASRLAGHTLSRPVINEMTGELLFDAGTTLTYEQAEQIQEAGVKAAFLTVECKEYYVTEAGENAIRFVQREVKVIGNGMVDLQPYVQFDISKYEINEKVSFSVLREILESSSTPEEVEEQVKKRLDELVPKHIILDDIYATISYFLNLCEGVGTVDDIDHLGNRRIRSVGELLQNQFRIGFTRMERVIRERMNIQAQDMDVITPQSLVNIRPITAAIKEFFGSSPLSQFMDQNNPLAELTHKRRLSALGPGGLSRDRAGFEVRDVHYSHYGRMCPIETPEGPNIGLISYLATFARINEYGFIEAPYRRVDKATGVVTDEVVYMTADVEDNYIVAQANEPLTEDGHFANHKVAARYREQILEVEQDRIDFMDVSPKMVVSVATSMIPFLENDDANRALMGSNMQRQAVPLLKTERPFVGTGMEYKAAVDSGVCVLAPCDGVITAVSADTITLLSDETHKEQTFKLEKFKRSNQGTCINQRPIVDAGEHVTKGQVLADGPSTSDGEISLGKNALIGFMTWEGYNYEDAVLLSERLVMDDVYTSIHIEEYESEARNTKLGDEEITRDIPNVGDDALKDLDETGIIRIGAEVSPNDILVGKVTPKGETELTAEERLLRAIFGEKAREVRDTSLRVPHGAGGIVVDVKVFTRENGDELAPGVNQNVRVYIAQKRKISVGDKMAGRHGNKGVVSRVLPVEDMPYLPNGRPLDIVLNPLGVPSRMNIGQVLEIHLGLASNALGWKVSTPVFEGANEEDIMQSLDMANDYANKSWEEFKDKWAETLKPEVLEYLGNHLDHRDEWRGVPIDHTGRVKLRDGRTGEEFDNPTTIGFMHYLKLHHLVDDKIHARSTGPYSLVTQQPLGGKAQFGGQRFGEMEVWALEAYGASYTLQEILTVKSDDIVGRVKTYEAIVKDENIPEPGVPESFKVLLKELQALGLDIKILREDNTEVEIQESIDDVDDFNINVNIEGVESDTEEETKNDGKVSLENVLGDIDLDDIDVDEEDSDDDFVISDEDVLEEADMLKEFEDLNKFLDADDDSDK